MTSSDDVQPDYPPETDNDAYLLSIPESSLSCVPSPDLYSYHFVGGDAAGPQRRDRTAYVWFDLSTGRYWPGTLFPYGPR
jgi:hypothetical protein